MPTPNPPPPAVSPADHAVLPALQLTSPPNQNPSEAVVGQGGTNNETTETLSTPTALHHLPYNHEEEDVRKTLASDPVAQQDGGDIDEALSYPDPNLDHPLTHPPDFRPFFTLIEDPSSGEHYHPAVHYIFTDDDPEILTTAALNAVDREHVRRDEALVGGGGEEEGGESGRGEGEEEIEDRIVILEISSDGKQIVSASSLSPEWQALTTHVGPAPSWGRHDGSIADRGMMLSISGCEMITNAAKEKTKGSDVEGLLKAFDEKLRSLESVLGGDDVGEAEVENLQVVA